jgi:hypothetical protein
MKILRTIWDVFASILLLGGFVWLWGHILGYTTLGLLLVGVLIWEASKNMLAERQRCVHGITHGKRGGCSQCIEKDRQRRREEWARIKELVDHSSELAENSFKIMANFLRESEISALRKRWLSRSELYFEMNPPDFEDAVADLYRELGYEVKQTPYSNDRGKDAIAWKDGKKYLIECKRYDATNTIGRRDLAILVAAMKEENADGGIYVNTGRFANTAPEYAAQENIELFDRATFSTLVNRAYPIREDVRCAKVMCDRCGVVQVLPVEDFPFRSTCANGHEIVNNITRQIVRSMSSRSKREFLTFCDRCGSRMCLIRGKYGTFWGCTKYPDCKFKKRIVKAPRSPSETSPTKPPL